jgi:hypothetical protein
MGLVMNLLSAVAGKKAVPLTIADLEVALERLAAERVAAREAVAQAMRERESLLLTDEDGKRIARAESEAARHRLTIERLDKLEPLLAAEFTSLRAEARRGAWNDLRTKYDAAAVAFAAAYRTALESLEALARIRGEAQEGGFAAEATAFAVAPNMLVAGLIDRFEAELERQRDAGRPKPAPAPRPVAPPPKAALAPVASAPKPKAAAVAPAPAPKPVFKPSADPEGNTRLVILRPGIELDGGARPRLGETVALPLDQASEIVRAGAAEFLEAI